MNDKDLIQARIQNKGFRNEDIKHTGRLSSEQICSIPVEKVYEWVKTGKWKQKDFQKWLKELRVI